MKVGIITASLLLDTRDGLRKAKRRIRELEDEVEILRRANALLGSSAHHPKGSTR